MRARSLPMEGPRRVAYVLQCFPQLSETFVENEMRAMEDLGVQVWVYSIYRPGQIPSGPPGPTAQDPARTAYRPGAAPLAAHFLLWALRRPVVTITHVWRALRRRSLTMLRGAWSAGWIASAVRRHGLSHVHAHFAIDSSCAGLVAAALARVPFTFTIHAQEIYLRSNGLCERVRAADRAVTVCHYNVDRLVELCPELGPADFEIVYCGVDPAAFGPAQTEAGDGDDRAQVRLLSVGRLVEKKGFDVLIRAVGVLRDRGHDVRCEIAGEGPLAGALDELIESSGLRGRVDLLGAMDPPEVAERLARSDVFVLACRIDAQGNRDSMPVVIKEAMASCLPVVSTTVAAVPEMVDAAVGRLAPPDDPVALADAVEEVIRAGPEGRRAMGRAGRCRVTERFDVATETAKLKDLFDRLVAGSGRGGG